MEPLDALGNRVAGGYSARAIQVAAVPAIIKVGALVLPPVIIGITPAPRTRRCESTTAIRSSARPIRVVPAG